MNISGWGRYPKIECRLYHPRSEIDLIRFLKKGDLIARGNGRAYGDSAINPRCTVNMRRFNKILSFESQTGELVVEAGVVLSDIIKIFLPGGWFPPVTPGTKFVTVGGMIAADVHGKNHHKHGSFGSFVNWIDLMDLTGVVHRCSLHQNSELFEWTIGGMGLTGIILRASFRLIPVESGWIQQNTIPVPNLTKAIDVFENNQDATYSVAWIDCIASGSSLGRSVVMLGEHAKKSDLPVNRKDKPYHIPNKLHFKMPFNLPGFVLNRYTVSAFNALYYKMRKSKAGMSLVDWDSYFYPLDAILEWNRIYGRKGFAQFQCVLPIENSLRGLEQLLQVISKSGQASFLTVLKRFGAQESRFSFPMQGYTLALDFPISHKNLKLMDELDRITIEHGGRFNLAKDSRMTSKILHRSDQRVKSFLEMRKSHNFLESFVSAQSERLKL